MIISIIGFLVTWHPHGERDGESELGEMREPGKCETDNMFAVFHLISNIPQQQCDNVRQMSLAIVND